jgi:uncharacterized protein (DUF2147 family)
MMETAARRRSTAHAALIVAIAGLLTVLAVSATAAAESPVGRWKTVDGKTGAVTSEVEIYEQGGKLFGRIVSMPDPNDASGKPKTCTKCNGADKDKPIIGLVIMRDLVLKGDRYKDGTILDPEDGKVYKGEIWIDNGKLKVRGYLGLFYDTRTWVRA